MNVQEFAKQVGVSSHTVRYYEKIGLFPDVKRTVSGHREFGEGDIAWMEFVLRLKNTGMPLADILAYSDLRSRGVKTLEQRQQMLQTHAQQLATHIQLQQECFRLLQEKISWYQNEISGATIKKVASQVSTKK
ncbi:MerR family transcriptional regulator [Undibacterium sp. RTI2.1]|uniref:MerR family transcriptional regulator n=1 Tax=unclassified Undibacterium TaxID=2630295 RepID=UPI002AB3CC12|nr:MULTISPECIES: MerR family transcriptional regulator [unclassified Undibacterium]MDY7540343.1 MerR family transcriptional regulator [Undibacterium sp. 5I1]MEB0029951.1 MerR family transcriptional regulator [Undibacterium sp. RTI2.1]MEB0117085.1 MerR family transcriptional regulator [Undibacterium sp. RTI2.2]MEB0229975.1 MerR family transcriptional regulator [Undibacterium sp. 10I3]MEB0259512.1 MerR family transcriptional regulator [Undibacterium sp. 5I1]